MNIVFDKLHCAVSRKYLRATVLYYIIFWWYNTQWCIVSSWNTQIVQCEEWQNQVMPVPPFPTSCSFASEVWNHFSHLLWIAFVLRCRWHKPFSLLFRFCTYLSISRYKYRRILYYILSKNQTKRRRVGRMWPFSNWWRR